MGDQERAWVVRCHSLLKKGFRHPHPTPTSSRPLAIKAEKQKPDEMQMPPIPDFRTSAMNGTFTLRVPRSLPLPSPDEGAHSDYRPSVHTHTALRRCVHTRLEKLRNNA